MMKGESTRKSWIGRGFRVIVAMSLGVNQKKAAQAISDAP
jgi:hypothetical protein